MNKLPLIKLIDIPPIWLAAMCVLAWLQARYLSFGLGFDGAWIDILGAILIGAGLLLMLLAVFEMRKHRTTVIPHLEARRLVSSGIFALSRNPIYLGDGLVLLGLILRWDAVLALALVPVFLCILQRRFILAEENRLRLAFDGHFVEYCQNVRRWL